MANVGDIVKLNTAIPTGVAPGQTQYSAGAGSRAKIIGTRVVNGQNYYNIDQTAYGGGTGWTPAATLEGSIAPPAPVTNPNPTSPSQVQPFLDQTHQNELVAAGAPPVRDAATIETQYGLTPPTQLGPKPAVPSLVDTYNNLRLQNGVAGLEQTLQGINDQEAKLNAQLYTNLTTEEGKPVAQDVISGRQTEEQRQASQTLAFLGVQKQQATDALNYAYNNIKTIVDLTGQDYTNATNAYNSQFTQNLQTIDFISKIQAADKTDQQHFIDNARANLQVYVNNIKDGGISLSNLDPNQQLALNKMEVAAGFYPGFLQSIKMDPKANIIATSTLPNGQTQVITRNSDGTVTAQSYGKEFPIATSRTGTATERTASQAALDLTAEASAKDAAGLKSGTSVFPTLVAEYAKELSLSQIKDAYMKSSLGQKWGAPTEAASVILAGYNYYHSGGGAGTVKSTAPATFGG